MQTITFAAIHFIIATTVAYLLTGDILIGSMTAMIEPSINMVALYFHEKFCVNMQVSFLNPPFAPLHFI